LQWTRLNAGSGQGTGDGQEAKNHQNLGSHLDCLRLEIEAETEVTGDLSVILSRTNMYSEFYRVDMDLFLFLYHLRIAALSSYLILDIMWE